MEAREMGATAKLSLLSLAAKKGDLLRVKELVSQGNSLNARDDNGANALHWASSRGHDGVCDYLLDAGCDVNARIKNGPTALHVAVDGGHSKCVKVLIKRGVDLNACTERGDTPLHHAAYRGHLEILSLLTEAGADPCRRNAYGITPFEEACARKHSDCAEHLLAYITQRKVDPPLLNSYHSSHDTIFESGCPALNHHVTSPPTSLNIKGYQNLKSIQNTTNYISLNNRLTKDTSAPTDVSGVMSLDSAYSSMSLPYSLPEHTALSLPSLVCREEESNSSFDSLLSKALPVKAQYGSPSVQKPQEIGDSLTRGKIHSNSEKSQFEVSSPPALPPRPSWLAGRNYSVPKETNATFNMISANNKIPRQSHNQWLEVLPGFQMSDFVEKLQMKVLELQEQLSASETSNVKLRQKVSQIEAENLCLKAENEKLLKSLKQVGSKSSIHSFYGNKSLREPVHGLSELDEGVHSSLFMESYDQSKTRFSQSSFRISREPVENNDNI